MPFFAEFPGAGTFLTLVVALARQGNESCPDLSCMRSIISIQANYFAGAFHSVSGRQSATGWRFLANGEIFSRGPSFTRCRNFPERLRFYAQALFSQGFSSIFQHALGQLPTSLLSIAGSSAGSITREFKPQIVGIDHTFDKTQVTTAGTVRRSSMMNTLAAHTASTRAAFTLVQIKRRPA